MSGIPGRPDLAHIAEQAARKRPRSRGNNDALSELARAMAPTEAQVRESVAMAAYLRSTQAATQATELQTLMATFSSLPPDSPFIERIRSKIDNLLDSMNP